MRRNENYEKYFITSICCRMLFYGKVELPIVKCATRILPDS